MAIAEKQKAALEALRPKATADAKNKSNYKIKDEHFDKEVSAKIDGVFQSIVADWRRLNVGGVQMVVIKGEAISKTELAIIKATEGALDYYAEKLVEKAAPKKASTKK